MSILDERISGQTAEKYGKKSLSWYFIVHWNITIYTALIRHEKGNAKKKTTDRQKQRDITPGATWMYNCIYNEIY